MDAREKAQFSGRIRNCARQLGQQGVAALGPLYDLTAPRLVRYAYMLTRNHADAEDAVQAAMVKIALKPRALSAARFPWAYFLKVVRNEALGIARRRKAIHVLSSLVEACSGPAAAFHDAEIKQCVQSAMQKLPPAQAEVVVLKIWEDMTFIEIGEILGESSNTAASRYRYAMAKLSHLLRRLSHEVQHV